MKSYLILILLLMFLPAGCKKNDTPRLSGTDTIDNTLFGNGPYYALGFSFSQAKKISTLNDPEPDITLVAVQNIDGSISKTTLQTNNLKNSYYKFGEYADAISSKQAFDNLKSAVVTLARWKEESDTIRINQVWIFRTGTEHYAKFRILNSVSEQRSGKPYAECKFEWVYQPDGSITFPGK